MTRIASTQIHRSSRRISTKLAGLIGCAVVLALLAAPSVVRAAEKSLPDAATILDKYVDVTGGKASYAKIHNRLSKERVVHADMDFEDSVVVYAAEPNRRYVEVESEAFGMIQNGTDGNIVWYLADNTGPVVQEGEARSAGLRAAAFNLATQWRELYRKAECVGEEVIDGRPCYKIVMTPNEGRVETVYFDKQSNLLVKVEKDLLFSNMPAVPTEFTFSDYRSVDGILLPHKYRRVMQQCGSKREMLFITDSIEHNVDMPANRFDPPKEILAVAKAASTKEPQSASSTSVAAAPSSGCGGGASASASKSASGGGSSGASGGAGCKGGCSGGGAGCGGGGGSSAAKTPSAGSGGGCCGSAKTAAAQDNNTQPRAKQGGCGG